MKIAYHVEHFEAAWAFSGPGSPEEAEQRGRIDPRQQTDVVGGKKNQ
jgi:hypothetical protein